MALVFYDTKRNIVPDPNAYSVVTWTPNTTYAYGQMIRPTVPNGFLYVCTMQSCPVLGLTNQGQSSDYEPSWPAAIGAAEVLEFKFIDGYNYNICSWSCFAQDGSYAENFSWSSPSYNTGTPTVENSPNYKDASVTIGDTGNQAIVGGINPENLSFPLIQNTVIAKKVAARELKKVSYPLAEGTCKFNRSVFKLEKGDNFALQVDTMYGITLMPVIVVGITEEGPDSDAIVVTWVEDPNYLNQSEFADISGIKSYISRGNDTTYGNTPLSKVSAFELPYGLSGDKIKIGILAGRALGSESGFNIYMSSDNLTYGYMTRSTKFSVYGVVAKGYDPPVTTIDDTIGVEIDFDLLNDVSVIESITRGQIGSLTNLAKLGNEFISFQTITPVAGYTKRYKLLGVYGGRFDTTKSRHVVGEPFWFLGADRYQVIDDSRLMKDSIRYFKCVPFTTDHVGKLERAAQVAIKLNGSAIVPYSVANLKINNQAICPRYTPSENAVLTWNLRLKDSGAGVSVIENLETPTISPVTIRITISYGIMTVPHSSNPSGYVAIVTASSFDSTAITYSISKAVLDFARTSFGATAIKVKVEPIVIVNQTRYTTNKPAELVAELAHWRP